MKRQAQSEDHITAAVLLSAAVVGWTLGPIMIKVIAGHLDGWTQNMLRFGSACAVWIPFLFHSLRRGKVPRQVWKLAILPALAIILSQTLFTAGFYLLDAGFLTLIGQTSVVWTAIIAMTLLSEERVLLKSRRFWVSVCCSLVGVAGVVGFKDGFSLRGTLPGVVLVCGFAFAWGSYTVLAKTRLAVVDARLGFAVVSIYAVLGLSVLGLVFGDTARIAQLDLTGWVCVILSGAVSIGMSHVLYYAAIKRVGPTISQMVLLVQPLLVLVVSHYVFGESFRLAQVPYGALLLAGSALAVSARTKH